MGLWVKVQVRVIEDVWKSDSRRPVRVAVPPPTFTLLLTSGFSLEASQEGKTKQIQNNNRLDASESLRHSFSHLLYEPNITLRVSHDVI